MRQKIKNLIQSLFQAKIQTVFVSEEYCIHCREDSQDTKMSYSYQYTKPSLIVTADRQEIPADRILKADKSDMPLVEGLRGEFRDSYQESGIRNREYLLYISREACPLKIKYSSGSGEGYNDSEYWSSDHKEYWISYICAPD